MISISRRGMSVPNRLLLAMALLLLAAAGSSGLVRAAPAASQPAIDAAPATLAACTEPPFSDVPIDHPFCAEISWMKDAAISTGFNDGTYRPSIAVTRQAMSAFMARLAGATLTACTEPPFADVPVDHPFCEEIKWMRDEGISTGFAVDNTYRPSIAVTRQAMSAFMARLADATLEACTEPPFADVPIDHPFCEEIQWMKESGVSTGFAVDNTYRPSLAVTRQAMSAFMYRVSLLLYQAPVLANLEADALAYTENGPAIPVTATLTVSDADSATLVGATVWLSAGFQSGQDVLSFTDQSGITGSWDAPSGTLTLAGAASPTSYQTALRAVRYHNTSEDPATVSRTVSFRIDDGGTHHNLSNVVSRDIAVTAVNDAPIAQSKTLTTHSSIKITIGALDSGQLKTGATDPDDAFGALSVSPTFTDINPPGATIVLTDPATGTYTYDPPPGYSGAASFRYTVCDDGAPNGPVMCSAPAIVNVTITGPDLWFVNPAAGSAGSGRLSDPFQSLAGLPVGRGTGDRVFVFSGSQAAGHTLLTSEQLIGQAATGSTFDALLGVLVPGNGTLAPRPALAGSPVTLGGTVTLASNAKVQGVAIASTTNTGLAGSGGLAGVDVSQTSISTTTGTALSLNNVAGTLNLTSLTKDGTGTGVSLTSVAANVTIPAGSIHNTTVNAVDITGGTGPFSYGGTISNTSGRAVQISNKTGGATHTFSGAVGTTGAPLGGAGISLVNNGSGGGATISFSGGVHLSTGTNAAFSATGGGTVNLTGSNTLATTTGAPTLSLGNVAGTISVASLTKNGTGTGVSLTNVAANVTIAGGSISGTTTGGILLDGGSGNFTYGGAISSLSSGRAVQVSNKSAGSTHTFSGAIGTPGAPLGGTGIGLTSNSGTTISFSGGVNLSTGTSAAFTASGGGTVNVTGSANTIATTTGRALEVNGTAIGGAGMTFRSVTITGGGSTTGIFLNNAGSGGFSITGTSSTAGSGGTIGSISGSDGATTVGIGVYINNTDNISLSNMTFSGTLANFGIRGVDVNNFTLRDSTSTGTFGSSNAADEGVVSFDNLTGTALFEGNNLAGGHEDIITVVNTTGTLNATFRDSAADAAVIGLNGTTTGNNGIGIQTGGSSTLTVLVDGVTFSGSRAGMVQVNATDQTTQTITIQNNTFHNAHPDITSGGGGITVSGGGAGSNYNISYLIQNNSHRGAEGNAINAIYLGTSGTVSGRILNNVIGVDDAGSPTGSANQATTGASNGGNGIYVNVEKDAASGVLTQAVRIEGNQIRDIHSGVGAISLRSNGNGTSGQSRLEATITNNVIEEMGSQILAGIYGMVGGAGPSGDFGLMGLNITNNNINMANSPGIGLVFDQISSDAHYYFPGYAGSTNGESFGGTASADLETFLTTSPKSNTVASAAGAVLAEAQNIQNTAFVLTVP